MWGRARVRRDFSVLVSPWARTDRHANDVTDGIAAAQRIVELGEQFLELAAAKPETGQEL
jgi:hypothetical protein